MKRVLLFGVVLALTVGLFTFISAKGPEYHAGYIRDKVGSKTVMILSKRSGGSGFFIETEKEDTYILTNRHICKLSKNGYMDIVVPGSEKVFKQKILKLSDKYDLCVIESIKGIEGLSLADDVEISETISIVGHPKLQPLTVSKGELIGYRYIQIATKNPLPADCKFGVVRELPPLTAVIFGIKSVCINNYYSGQVTAYSRGGSSGSPVVNFYGNIVGVLFAGSVKDQFVSFAVPLEDIREFLNGL